jgi:hypothetical protein
MTVDLWNRAVNLANGIENTLAQTDNQAIVNTDQKYNWHNKFYHCDRYRRAHVEIVDNRETHKLYIIHCTIFPHYNDPSPIWGFDIVCGQSKITGAFLDFSNAGDPDHFMMKWFKDQTKDITWNKPRNLPDWAKQIFSPAMVAAGNINTEQEFDLLENLALKSLNYYLANVGYTQQSGMDYHMAQNRYCYYQKQNPHVVNSMVSMGVDETVMRDFVSELLFPETI